MHRAARLSAILARLANGGSVAVADLADDLDASPATIRRDLVILEQQRLLARTHGGAIAHAVSYELPLRYKGVRYADEKRRIARQAAAYVSEGMAVGLTGGTTATEVARAIATGDPPSLPSAYTQQLYSAAPYFQDVKTLNNYSAPRPVNPSARRPRRPRSRRRSG